MIPSAAIIVAMTMKARKLDGELGALGCLMLDGFPHDCVRG